MEINLNTSPDFDEEVRTLFVSGLPMDAKPRELYLLFRGYQGYETSLLKVTSKNGKTTTVSLLKDHSVKGVRFDPDLPTTLRLEFAKSNTKVTKQKQQTSPLQAAQHPALVHPLYANIVPEAWNQLAYEIPGTGAALINPIIQQQLQQQLTQIPMGQYTVAPNYAMGAGNGQTQIPTSPPIGSPVATSQHAGMPTFFLTNNFGQLPQLQEDKFDLLNK